MKANTLTLQDEAPPTFGTVTGKETMTLTLYVDEARKMQEATGLVPYILGNAASVFRLIYRITAAGFPMEEHELCGLAELCQRGLSAVEEKEGEAVSTLDMLLRIVLSHHDKKEGKE